MNDNIIIFDADDKVLKVFKEYLDFIEKYPSLQINLAYFCVEIIHYFSAKSVEEAIVDLTSRKLSGSNLSGKYIINKQMIIKLEAILHNILFKRCMLDNAKLFLVDFNEKTDLSLASLNNATGLNPARLYKASGIAHILLTYDDPNYFIQRDALTFKKLLNNEFLEKRDKYEIQKKIDNELKDLFDDCLYKRLEVIPQVIKDEEDIDSAIVRLNHLIHSDNKSDVREIGESAAVNQKLYSSIYKKTFSLINLYMKEANLFEHDVAIEMYSYLICIARKNENEKFINHAYKNYFRYLKNKILKMQHDKDYLEDTLLKLYPGFIQSYQEIRKYKDNFNYTHSEMIKLIKNILFQAERTLNLSYHNKFSVLILGSFATGKIHLYSDIEYIVIADSSYTLDEEFRDYITNFMLLFEALVAAFGETEIIKADTILLNQEKNYKKFLIPGFQVKAFKRSKSRIEEVGLINSPKSLIASIPEFFDFRLKSALLSPSFIYGSKAYYLEYIHLLKNKIESGEYKHVIKECSKLSSTSFSKYAEDFIHRESSEYNIKEILIYSSESIKFLACLLKITPTTVDDSSDYFANIFNTIRSKIGNNHGDLLHQWNHCINELKSLYIIKQKVHETSNIYIKLVELKCNFFELYRKIESLKKEILLKVKNEQFASEFKLKPIEEILIVKDKLPLLKNEDLSAIEHNANIFRFLTCRGYNWRSLLNTHVFDLNLTEEARKTSEAIIKELIAKRDALDKELYLLAVQFLLGDYGKLSDEQRYYYNRIPKKTGPKTDLTGYKLEYYVLEILDKQQNDKPIFTVCIIAPGSRDLSSDIDTTVEVTCHQKAIVLPLNLPKEFGEISLSEMDIELVIQAGIVYHFNQLNCEKLGQTSAESRDSNVYIDGFMHALAFPKFDDFAWKDEAQQESSGIQLVKNKLKKVFYQTQKHQRNVLELAASLLPLRSYYQKDGKAFTKQLKALFAIHSLNRSNQASFDKLMQEVLAKVEALYHYQQIQMDSIKANEVIQQQYLTVCSQNLGKTLSNADLMHERAEDFERYVNNILYAKHILGVAKVRKQISIIANALSNEKNALAVLQAELQKFDKSIHNGKKKIEQATDDEDKEAFELKLNLDQTKRTNCYKDKFLPQLKSYVANLEAFANLQIQQQEALIKAQLFALEAYMNYSAPYHIVKWQQSGDDNTRIDRRRIALCSALQQIGFQLLHAQRYQALGMEPGQILYRVAKYGQRVADIFFGDSQQWFGDTEHTYHETDIILRRFKAEITAKTFGENLYDLLNLQIALVKNIKKNDEILPHEKGRQAILLCLKRYMKDYKNPPVDVDGLSHNIIDTVLAEEKVNLDNWLKVKDIVLIDTMGKLIVEAYRAKTNSYLTAGKQLCWGTLFNAMGSSQQNSPTLTGSEANNTNQKVPAKK